MTPAELDKLIATKVLARERDVVKCEKLAAMEAMEEVRNAARAATKALKERTVEDPNGTLKQAAKSAYDALSLAGVHVAKATEAAAAVPGDGDFEATAFEQAKAGRKRASRKGTAGALRAASQKKRKMAKAAIPAGSDHGKLMRKACDTTRKTRAAAMRLRDALKAFECARLRYENDWSLLVQQVGIDPGFLSVFTAAMRLCQLRTNNVLSGEFCRLVVETTRTEYQRTCQKAYSTALGKRQREGYELLDAELQAIGLSEYPAANLLELLTNPAHPLFNLAQQ